MAEVLREMTEGLMEMILIIARVLVEAVEAVMLMVEEQMLMSGWK